MNRTCFRLSDKKEKKEGRIAISLNNARYWNDRGYGIFWSVNEFNDNVKKYTADNIKSIYSWFCELDGNVNELEEYILRIALYPSLIIRTKNGFHLYWDALDGTILNYSAIQARIQHTIGQADPRCKDIARILRVPGFDHMKDPADPFQINVHDNSGNKYTEREMKLFFLPVPKNEKPPYTGVSQDFPSRRSLEILSGTEFVNKEKYSFRNNSDNSLQIVVNGATTSCWIDDNDFIGSHDGGGPTIIQWLRWYGLRGRTLHEAKTYLSDKLGIDT